MSFHRNGEAPSHGYGEQRPLVTGAPDASAVPRPGDDAGDDRSHHDGEWAHMANRKRSDGDERCESKGNKDDEGVRAAGPPEEEVAPDAVPPPQDEPPPKSSAAPLPRKRTILRKKYAKKIHVYAVPANSYYGPIADPEEAEDARERGREPPPPQGPQPVQVRRQPPRRLAGRLMEQQRHSLPSCPPYRIPLYDQACFKYIFPNLFKNVKRKNKFEVFQLFFLCQMFILAIVNIIMTVVNVFFNDPVSNILPWARGLTVVVFSIEFAVVAFLSLFTGLLIVHAVVVNRRGRASDRRRWKLDRESRAKSNVKEEEREEETEQQRRRRRQQRQRCPTSAGGGASPTASSNGPPTASDKAATATGPYAHRRKNGLVIGTTELAQDCAVLITLIGTFSVLRIIGLASPSFAFRRILPILQNAATLTDVVKGTTYLLLWLLACVLAFMIVIAKVTQISFAFTASISDWTIANYVQLLGLLFNLARVDDSYYKETSVLLDAVHQHYSPPGEVREYFSTWSVSADTQKKELEWSFHDLLSSPSAKGPGQQQWGLGADSSDSGSRDDSETNLTSTHNRRTAQPSPHVGVEEATHFGGTASAPSSHHDRRSCARCVTDEPVSAAMVGREEATGGLSNSHNASLTKRPRREAEEGRGEERQSQRRAWAETVEAQARLTNTPSLLTRILKALRIPPFMYFTYFAVIYDYHFNSYQREDERDRAKAKAKRTLERQAAAAKRRNCPSSRGKAARYRTTGGGGGGDDDDDSEDDGPPQQLPIKTHLYSFFNYLSFIFEIDNIQLRRYLQMIRSPLPFYGIGRDSFMAAFVEKDVVCMDMALWRSDPTLRATQRYAMAHPGQFNIAYTCEDRRDIWDPGYIEWAQLQEIHNAVLLAKDVVNVVRNASETHPHP